MPNEGTKTARHGMFAAAAMLLTLMLVYPGMLLCVPVWNLLFFETGTIVLVMVGISMLFPSRVMEVSDHLPRGLMLAVNVLAAIAFWHWIRHGRQYSAAEVGELFLAVSIPFVSCMFETELKRLLPAVLALFWGIDAALGFVQYYALHWHLFGLPQNINWNASLLAVSAPFTILALWRLPLRRGVKFSLAAAVCGVTVWQILLTGSRGTLFGCAAAAVLWAVPHMKPFWRRMSLYAAFAAVVLGALCFIMLVPKDAVRDDLARDERVFLAYTTMDMIAARPKLGYGAPSFETEYLNFRRPEFFFMRHSAVRIDHPHNQTLYMAASFGLLGLLCWLYLVLEPMYYAERNIRKMDAVPQLSLLCLAGLLVHGQFDLVLFRWPTNILAMMFLGILLHEREGLPGPFWRPPELLRRFRVQFRLAQYRNPDGRVGRTTRVLLAMFGAAILCTGLFFALSSLSAEILSWGAGKAEAEEDSQRAAELHWKAASKPGSNLALKARAMSYASRHDPSRIKLYYDMFRESSTPEYGYTNDYCAFACVLSGHARDAVPFLKRSIALRPWSVIPLIMLSDVYKMTGQKGAEDGVRERLAYVMAYRFLTPADLEIIIRNQELDLHTWFRRDSKIMKENNL